MITRANTSNSWTVSAPLVKCECSDDEESAARRLAMRTEPAQVISKEEAMVTIALEDLRSIAEQRREDP